MQHQDQELEQIEDAVHNTRVRGTQDEYMNGMICVGGTKYDWIPSCHEGNIQVENGEHLSVGRRTDQIQANCLQRANMDVLF